MNSKSPTEENAEKKRLQIIHKKSVRFDALWQAMQKEVGSKKVLDGYKTTFKNLIVN